ncbi:DUF5996 family protein [Spirillospora sp. NPDC048819]|uniref:DUF5996 family protein n=1 Tax=Spirillospora sp. NPDC048819 TaxID=3155268 RepID=UPI003400AECF
MTYNLLHSASIIRNAGGFPAYGNQRTDGGRRGPSRPRRDPLRQPARVEAARAAPDPDRAVTEFLHTTCEAAADRGRWDRSTLEDNPFRCPSLSDSEETWGRTSLL